MTKIILGKQIESNEDFVVDVDGLIEGGLLMTASSGNGKSHMIKRCLQKTYGLCGQIVIDPEGDFNTMRTNKYDYIIAGKDENADIKITHKGEFPALLAQKILELNANIIIDLYELDPHEQKEFVAKFVRALVDIPKHLWGKKYVVAIDEAHELCPEEKKKNESTEAKDAIIALAAKGRKRGIRLIAATQRLSKLSKNATSELKNQLVGGLNNSDDRKRACDEIGFDKSNSDIFRTLEIGNFYAVGPAFGLKEARLVRTDELDDNVPAKSTDENSRYIRPPTAKVKSILSNLADLPQQAEKELKTKQDLEAEVARLRMELRRKDLESSRHATKPVQAQPSQEQIKQIHNEGYKKGWNDCWNEWNKFASPISADLGKIADRIDQVVSVKATLEGLQKSFVDKLPKSAANVSKISSAPSPSLVATKNLGFVKKNNADVAIENYRKYGSIMSEKQDSGNGEYTRMEREILKFLALRENGTFSESQIAVMTCYAVSGGFKNSLSKLKVAGLIIKNGPESIRINPDRIGDVIAILGDEYRRQDRNTLEEWMHGKLEKMPNEIYRFLYENQGNAYTIDELASALNYAVSGGFKNAISKLNVLTLIKKTPDKKIMFNTDLLIL